MLELFFLRLMPLRLLIEKKISLSFHKENILQHKKYKMFTLISQKLTKYFWLGNLKKIMRLRLCWQINKAFKVWQNKLGLRNLMKKYVKTRKLEQNFCKRWASLEGKKDSKGSKSLVIYLLRRKVCNKKVLWQTQWKFKDI